MKLSAIIFAIALLTTSIPAHSQSGPSARSVDIPFAFTAQGSKLPAGHYLLWYEEDHRIWKLRNFAHMDIELKAVRQRQSPMGQRGSRHAHFADRSRDRSPKRICVRSRPAACRIALNGCPADTVEGSNRETRT
jgi:hypothetical protein